MLHSLEINHFVMSTYGAGISLFVIVRSSSCFMYFSLVLSSESNKKASEYFVMLCSFLSSESNEKASVTVILNVSHGPFWANMKGIRWGS